MNIHIGQLIKKHFDDSGLTLIAFANKTFLQRQNIKKSVFEKTSIDTAILVRISKVLGHNFFQYYMSELNLPSNGNLLLDEPNEKYSLTEKKETARRKVTISFDFDDPDIKTQILELIQRTA